MAQEHKSSFSQQIYMCLYPCSYLCKPNLEPVDCCSCYHEKGKTEQLNIPPLIQISSTWINPLKPIPKWFIITRFSITLCLIIILSFNFSLYIEAGQTQYWFIYFTQWNIILATISMMVKSISTAKIYSLSKQFMLDNHLYAQTLSPNTILWKLYIIQSILLPLTLPSNSVISFELIYLEILYLIFIIFFTKILNKYTNKYNHFKLLAV